MTHATDPAAETGRVGRRDQSARSCRARAIAPTATRSSACSAFTPNTSPAIFPAGTEIEVTLTVDEFSRTEARGLCPAARPVVRRDRQARGRGKIGRAGQSSLDEQQERLKLLEQQAAELEADQRRRPCSTSGSAKSSR